VTNLELARQYGTKAAWATHKAHDVATARVWQARQRNLEYSNPTERGPLANAYREAYQTEASYYIGGAL
jgi:hypothetical protein